MKTKLICTSAFLLLLVALAFALQPPTTLAAPKAFCISTANGDWAVNTTWSNCAGGVPGASDYAVIQHTVTMTSSVSALSVIVASGGTLQGGTGGSLTAGTMSIDGNGSFNGNGNNVTLTGDLSVNATTASFTAGNGVVDLQGNVGNKGTFTAGSSTTIQGNVTNYSLAIFSLNNNNVTFKGNLTNNGMFTPGTGTATFDSASPQTLAGTLTFYKLTINKSSNNVTAGSDLTVDNELTLTSGDLDMASYTLTMGGSATTSGTRDVIGAVKRTTPTAGAKSYGSQYTTLDFSSAPGVDVTMTMVKQDPSGLGSRYVKRRYFISANTTVSTTVRLHYRDGDLFGSPTESQLNLWRYDSAEGRWKMQNKTAFNDGTDDNWVEKFGVTTFSEWAIAKDSAPTAVTLSSFTAAPATTDLILPGLALAVLGAIAGAWKLRRT